MAVFKAKVPTDERGAPAGATADSDYWVILSSKETEEDINDYREWSIPTLRNR